MQIFLICFIVAINIFSIILGYKMLKDLDLNKKILLLIIGELILFFIVNIIYNIGSRGIEQDVIDASKNFLVFTFLPINMILIFAPIARLLNKKIFSEIEEKDFKIKLIICIIFAIIILILECNYLKDIEIGILNMKR